MHLKLNYFSKIALDIVLSFLALALAMLLRFDLQVPLNYWSVFPLTAVIFAFFNIFSGVITSNFKSISAFAGAIDLTRALLSVFLTGLVLFVLKLTDILDFSGSIIVIYLFIMFTFTVAVRFAPKICLFINDSIKKRVLHSGGGTLVIGDGESIMSVIRRLREDKNSGNVTAILTEEQKYWGASLLGAKVLGGYDLIISAITKYNINEVVYSLQKGSGSLKELYKICQQNDVSFKVFQQFEEVNDYDGMPRHIIRDVSIEDLLGRNEIRLEKDWIDGFIKNKTILVTGGAGSIGSQICRQCLDFKCKKLIIFDINENGLFEMDVDLSKSNPGGDFVTVLGSVRDKNRLKSVFDAYAPDVVFHAAAHKHVPMIEGNPCEALKNNIFGTLNVINQCNDSKVKKLIVISTDKAVNPANIMGASKRVTEMLVQVFGRESYTEMAAVRFGNVLGSNGSVIPLFKKQIEQGGPVTVTHRDVERYFMTIAEAVQLVLQAAALATQGEIFVFDMGKLVKIYDLACELIRLSGLEPERDIEIKFVGLRPGEKLFEELRLDKEQVDITRHEKIFVCKPLDMSPAVLRKHLDELERIIDSEDAGRVAEALFDLVPSAYRDSCKLSAYKKPGLSRAFNSR